MYADKGESQSFNGLFIGSDETSNSKYTIVHQTNDVNMENEMADSGANTYYVKKPSVNNPDNCNNLGSSSSVFYRKPCNCAKSHCLKLYCECFARGCACDNCNCRNCMNNYLHEGDRRRAIKRTLERNPLAFHPKIGDGERRHPSGCNCKRSGCLKNYCECYEAKISCSDLCRCQGCLNTEEGRMQKNFQAKPFFTARQETPLHKKFHTSEVVEAMCRRIIAVLSEATLQNVPSVLQERIIIEEFGRCLEKILESITRLRIMDHLSDYSSAEKYGHVDNPDFVTVLPTLQDSLSLQTANQDQTTTHRNPDCCYSFDQAFQKFCSDNEYGNSEHSRLCSSTTMEQHELGSIKQKNNSSTIENRYTSEYSEDYRFPTTQSVESLDKPLISSSFPDFCNLISFSQHQPESPQSYTHDVHDGCVEADYPKTLRPESYVLSTNLQFPNVSDSGAVGNSQLHSQAFEISSREYHGNHCGGNINEFSTTNPIGTVLGSSLDENEHLTTACGEDEEVNTAIAALLNVSLQYHQNPFNLSSEVDFIGLTEETASIQLYSDEIS
ncbi:unnamed protein product [Heterobilharzia americana]|nr:unnamed protein product [Heterobilharzia americana]